MNLQMAMAAIISFFISLNVHALGSISVKQIQGKIINYSDYPSSEFVISYRLSCQKRTFLGFYESCGSKSKEVAVKTDGSYTLPALKVKKSSKNELEFFIHFKDQKARALSIEFKSWEFGKKEIQKEKYKKLANITIFKLNKQNVEYDLDTNIDRKQFLKGKGRDLINEFLFTFPGMGEDYERISFIGENQMPASLFFVLGHHPRDVNVKIEASLGKWASSYDAYSTIKTESAFSSELSSVLKTFKVVYNDIPNFNRDLNGLWNKANIHFVDYGSDRHEYLFLDGSMEITCREGKLTGSMDLEARGDGDRLGNPSQIDLFGTCEEDSAKISFQVKYHSQDPVDTVSFTVEKIARGFHWVQFNTQSNEEDGALKIYNSQGKNIGTIRVSRPKN